MALRKIGLQLFSLRDETQRDFRGTIEKVARMGYAGVEFAGYGGLTPKEMAALLGDNGLTAYGSHIGALPKTQAELDAEIEMNLAVGSRYLVCPWQDMASRDDALRFAEIMNETAAKLRPHGLRLGYHNHAHEFLVDGGETLLDALMRRVEPDVFLELDVFWAAYAGHDPLRFIRRYEKRQPLMHLKELGADRKSNVECGAGVVDFDAVFRAGEQAGVEHFIVEQEEYTLPPLESCKVSLNNLMNI